MLLPYIISFLVLHVLYVYVYSTVTGSLSKYCCLHLLLFDCDFIHSSWAICHFYLTKPFSMEDWLRWRFSSTTSFTKLDILSVIFLFSLHSIILDICQLLLLCLGVCWLFSISLLLYFFLFVWLYSSWHPCIQASGYAFLDHRILLNILLTNLDEIRSLDVHHVASHT